MPGQRVRFDPGEEQRRLTIAPGLSSQGLFALGDRNASRGSSRDNKQTISRPDGSSVGTSFIEWTARSIVRFSSASSISLVKSPLPPISARRPVLQAIAGRPDHYEVDSSRR